MFRIVRQHEADNIFEEAHRYINTQIHAHRGEL